MTLNGLSGEMLRRREKHPRSEPIPTQLTVLRGYTKMQITDVKVRKLFDDGPMKAIVSVTFDGQHAVHDIKVIYARDKYFIVMPSRKNPDGTYRDIVHPINATFRSELEDAVIAEFNAEMARAAEAGEAETADAAEEEVPV